MTGKQRNNERIHHGKGMWVEFILVAMCITVTEHHAHVVCERDNVKGDPRGELVPLIVVVANPVLAQEEINEDGVGVGDHDERECGRRKGDGGDGVFKRLGYWVRCWCLWGWDVG